jgi:hypothetical protein
MQEIRGPIEVIGVEFDSDGRFDGRIAAELERLETESLVKIIALLFVHRDAATGQLEALDLQADADGNVTDLLAGDAEAARHSELLTALDLDLEDLRETAANLPPGTSAGFLLMEHLWARGLHDAIRATHGTPFLQGFVNREAAPQAGG